MKFIPEDCRKKFRPVAGNQLLFSLDETDIEVENVCSEDYTRRSVQMTLQPASAASSALEGERVYPANRSYRQPSDEHMPGLQALLAQAMASSCMRY